MDNFKLNKDRNGFTMVELLIAMTVGIIIMTAIYAMINLGQGTSGSVSRRIMTQQDARAVLDLMALEISMVSYNPRISGDTWNGPMVGPICTGAMTRARKGIQVATTSQIGLAMDLNVSGNICDVSNEYIVYSYSSANQTITRSTDCGSAQPVLGGTSAGSSTLVRNNQTTPATSLFRYFDLSGNEITTLDDTSIPRIKRIRITIIADDQVSDTSGGLYKVGTRTYTTDVLVRNHAMSP